MKRRKITAADKIATLTNQATCGCGCNMPFDADVGAGPQSVEYHHLHELALGGPDTADNLVAVRKDCHDRITNGTKATTAGSSKHKIAKADRLEKARLALANAAKPNPPAAITERFKPVARRQDPRIEPTATGDDAMMIPKRRGYSMLSKPKGKRR